MGKIKTAIIEAGSLQSAWFNSLQKLELPKETLAIIEEVVQAEKELMKRRGSVGDRAISTEVVKVIDDLLDRYSLTAGGLQAKLQEVFKDHPEKVPSRPTCHRYIVKWRERQHLHGTVHLRLPREMQKKKSK